MISGKFDVSMKPMDAYATGVDGIRLGRMSIDKTFSGGLSAVSKGEMLNALTPGWLGRLRCHGTGIRRIGGETRKLRLAAFRAHGAGGTAAYARGCS